MMMWNLKASRYLYSIIMNHIIATEFNAKIGGGVSQISILYQLSK